LIPKENIRIIHIKRSREFIAQSLKKRNNISIDKGRRLAEYYDKKIKNNFYPIPSDNIFTCYYDDFFGKFKNDIIHQLCVFAGLRTPSEETFKKIHKFIDPKLRHWK
jgi:hypothetical protein